MRFCLMPTVTPHKDEVDPKFYFNTQRKNNIEYPSEMMLISQCYTTPGPICEEGTVPCGR